MKESPADPIVKRLDIIIRIMMEFRREQDEKLNMGDLLVYLESTSLSPTEAAHILGIDPSQLTSYRKRARRGTRKATKG